MRKIPDDEEKLVNRMMFFAEQYGRYGFRRITALLRTRAGILITSEWKGSGGRRV